MSSAGYPTLSESGVAASEPHCAQQRRSPTVLWALAALMIAMGTLVLPGGRPWVGIRTFALEATGILLAMLVVSRGEWTRQRVYAALLSAPNWAICSFLVWVGLSAAMSSLPEFSRFDALRHLGGGLVYFSIVYGLSARRHLCSLVMILSTAGGLAAIVAFGALVRSDSRTLLSGAFTNEQLLAAVLCVLLPITLVSALAEQDGWRQNVGQVCAVLVGIGILATQNRSVWIGSAVSLVALAALYARFGRASATRPKKDTLVVYGVVLVLGAMLFLGMSRMGVTLSQRAATLPNLSETESFRWRQGMWDKALRMTRARPLMGWGIGTFPINQALFFHPACRFRDQRTILLKGATLYENAHNTYLQMSAEIGLIGLSLYLAVLGSFVVSGVRLLPRIQSRYRARILCGSIAAVIGQAVSGIGNPAWEFAQCSLFLWVAIGVGALAAGIGDRGRTSDQAAV